MVDELPSAPSASPEAQAKDPSADLNPQQKRFCEEYLIDLNATRAAERAGYAGNEATLAVTGYRLLRHDKVNLYCRELMTARSERTKINADEILAELYKIATVDVTQAFDDMGGMKPFNEMPPEVRKAISSLEVSELFDGRGDSRTAIGLLRKIRVCDKVRALELLGKHLKLFAERVEHSGPDGKPIEHRDLTNLPDEQLNARIEKLLKKSVGTGGAGDGGVPCPT